MLNIYYQKHVSWKCFLHKTEKWIIHSQQKIYNIEKIRCQNFTPSKYIFKKIHKANSSEKLYTSIISTHNDSKITFYIYFSIYRFASFKKQIAIMTITIPIGNAAIILTDCKLLIELSAKSNAIGKRINKIHHIN